MPMAPASALSPTTIGKMPPLPGSQNEDPRYRNRNYRGFPPGGIHTSAFVTAARRRTVAAANRTERQSDLEFNASPPRMGGWGIHRLSRTLGPGSGRAPQ